MALIVIQDQLLKTKLSSITILNNMIHNDYLLLSLYIYHPPRRSEYAKQRNCLFYLLRRPPMVYIIAASPSSSDRMYEYQV